VDIHPPHAIHSWKDFGVQLITITAGVLIALSLEGVRESIHDRALVREARTNIHREIADNKREVDDEITGMAERTRKIDAALGLANALLKDKHTEVHQLELGLALPSFSAASWQTAERTGALAHMDYAEVQKYAALYSFQEFLAEQHRHALDALSAAIGIITASEGGDPINARPPDLERFRDHVMSLRSILYIEEQMTRTASDRYKKALE
jgi:hypothetical protein